MLLPVLKQINNDQNDELEIEAEMKGNMVALRILNSRPCIKFRLITEKLLVIIILYVTGETLSNLHIMQAELSCNEQKCW